MSEGYRIGELAALAGVSKRTVHYYAGKGLIPPAAGSGVNSYYTDEHLHRIRLIKRLQERFLPLEEIRKVVTGLSLAEVQERLAGLEEVEEPGTTLMESAASYRSESRPVEGSDEVYIRVSLGSGLELHYPQRLAADLPGKIEAIVIYARSRLRERGEPE